LAYLVVYSQPVAMPTIALANRADHSPAGGRQTRRWRVHHMTTASMQMLAKIRIRKSYEKVSVLSRICLQAPSSMA
jgi:hypothetical protein